MNDEMNKKLLNDYRFKIDEFALYNHLQISKIISYRIELIEVGKILRQQDNKIYSMKYADPTKFLKTKDEKAYTEYCNKICVGEDNNHHNVEIFNDLINKFSNEDYDIRKGAIVINQLNLIMDGQHRCAILLDKYGENYVIPVVKIKYSYLGVRTYLNYIIYKLTHLK